MKREFIHKLLNWKQLPDRKPLILTGVRQCGKTYILKQFGSDHFPNYHYFNFEKQSDLHHIFVRDLDPKRIINELAIKNNKSIDIHTDLVIFDEIQACPSALTSLKYFNEEMNELHLCSAGSLLGVTLNNTSFPVGQINSFKLYPLTFYEFLLALGKDNLYELVKYIGQNHNYQLPTIAHQELWQIMQWYWITGGLPEVVASFINNQQDLFKAFQIVRSKQEDLIFTYYGDIAKHSGKINAMHIDRVWRSIPKQLSRSLDDSTKKFQFKNIIPGIDKYSRLAGALDWLSASDLILRLPIINNAEIPLSAYSTESKFKCFLVDVGLLGTMNNLPFKSILDYNFGTYKGYFAENFVAQQLMAYSNSDLFSWQDNRNEIEFVIQHEELVLPVEVKSGWITKSKSLYKFKEKYQPKFITIMSGHELKIDLKNNIHHYPLYLSGSFPIVY